MGEVVFGKDELEAFSEYMVARINGEIAKGNEAPEQLFTELGRVAYEMSKEKPMVQAIRAQV